MTPNGKLRCDSVPKSAHCVTVGGRSWIFITGRLLLKNVDDFGRGAKAVKLFFCIFRFRLHFKLLEDAF